MECMFFQVDIIIASFVTSSDSLIQLKQMLGEKGKKISIVANIQTEEGFRNFDDIITVINHVTIFNITSVVRNHVIDID